MLRNYVEVRDWLESFIPQVYGKNELGLSRIENLLERLGNPHKEFKSIHVAGTSGKGSTAFYISRLLLEKDFKTGLHVSPHLFDIRERMQINGKMIPLNQFISLANDIKEVVDEIKAENECLVPSYFEILVAMTFLHFAKEQVDWAVVEVGLGGRLDATNVLIPEVSVITNIGLDHTEILGDTVEKIAAEKAGIIKTNVPVVTGAVGKALEVIKKAAKKHNSILVTNFIQLKNIGSKTDILMNISRYESWLAFSKKNFGLINKKLAILAVLALEIPLKKTDIVNAFSANFSGRFEEISDGIVLDAAHNEDKISYLVNLVNKSKVKSQKSKMVLVVAFKKGKNWQKMLDILIKKLVVKTVIATEYKAATDTGFGSAVKAEEIASYLTENKRLKTNVKLIRNSQEAVFEALSNKKINEIVLVTGSLYLVGEARTLWKLPEF